MMSIYPRILAAGDGALTVEFGATIAPEIHDQVMAFTQAVSTLNGSGMIEIVPTYRSATIYFDPVTTNTAILTARLRALTESSPSLGNHRLRVIEIPVLYGAEGGPDLGDVAAFARISDEDVITLHVSIEYRVYMLGFSPGFPYMGRVPDKIAMPRLSTPRQKVPAGSVGIAGLQTGIYSIESPGGWRLIGRTPLRLYDPERTTPFLLEPNNRIRFVPINRDEYDRLSRIG